MKKVKCISTRQFMPNQTEIGKMYYMDETTIYKNDNEKEYATFYLDKEGRNRIGNLCLSRFCMMEDGNCMACDTCNN